MSSPRPYNLIQPAPAVVILPDADGGLNFYEQVRATMLAQDLGYVGLFRLLFTMPTCKMLPIVWKALRSRRGSVLYSVHNKHMIMYTYIYCMQKKGCSSSKASCIRSYNLSQCFLFCPVLLYSKIIDTAALEYCTLTLLSPRDLHLLDHPGHAQQAIQIMLRVITAHIPLRQASPEAT
jgi:hypothetical protein